MPVYLAPGVYVEEVSGTPPIVGVGTSTAAFIGEVDSSVVMPFKPGRPLDPLYVLPDDRFELALLNTAKLVTNFEQFKNNFGDFQAGNQILTHAVFGFFLNGGTRCWVIRVADLENANEVGDALSQLEKIDEIAIVAAPGALEQDVQLAVIEHCESLKDRFAIIDGQKAINDDGTTITIDASSIQGTVRNSDYAALYFPWIKVVDRTPDPLTGKSAAGKQLLVPPSASMAGIYSRVDQTRGVHKAPANEIVRGALDLEYLVSRAEQEGLNPKGINVIRGFDGNIRVWGARTLEDPPGEFKYINVRRLFNFLRESIDEGTQFAVFEPNAPPLWQKIRRSVTAFLTNVWRDGALFGNTPEEAFFVRCDETTNPPDVRDLGQVITEIGVAVVKPAEFVIFRISQVTSGANT